jgi:hypothetical protein
LAFLVAPRCLAAYGARATGDGLDKGYFVRPTVFDHVTPDMRIAREEVFGPVLALMVAEDFEDAMRLANGVRSQPRKRINDFWIDAVLLAPGCGFLLLAMAVPIAQLLLASVGLFGLGRTTAFTVANYARIADDVLLRSGFFFSLRIALATMACSVVTVTSTTSPR